MGQRSVRSWLNLQFRCGIASPTAIYMIYRSSFFHQLTGTHCHATLAEPRQSIEACQSWPGPAICCVGHIPPSSLLGPLYFAPFLAGHIFGLPRLMKLDILFWQKKMMIVYGFTWACLHGLWVVVVVIDLFTWTWLLLTWIASLCNWYFIHADLHIASPFCIFLNLFSIIKILYPVRFAPSASWYLWCLYRMHTCSQSIGHDPMWAVKFTHEWFPYRYSPIMHGGSHNRRCKYVTIKCQKSR